MFFCTMSFPVFFALFFCLFQAVSTYYYIPNTFRNREYFGMPYFEPAGFLLYKRIKAQYNSSEQKSVLPVKTIDENVKVRILLKLVQLTDIDERNQIMTTTVWVRHEWYDAGLIWNPKYYGNITNIQLPSDDVWVPDTVLYNNAEGDYQITIKTKVTIHYDGRVVWIPPAIYKSFCSIDVQYFPFDEQTCKLKFGPWTYDTKNVDYWLYDYLDFNKTLVAHLTQAADMTEFSKSVEWDILQITGNRTTFRYPCCEDDYVDITYIIHIRRKPLFYTINLIIPWACISCLTVFVFYLPSESSEKITLSVSILVALTVFILLLYEIIPPTSLALPLISKYLLFTMVMVTSSIAITVLILNIHFRHPHALDMPDWVRVWFLGFLPRLLFYKSPLEKWYRQQDELIEECFKVTDRESDYYQNPNEANNRLAMYDPWAWPNNNLEQSCYENVVFMSQSTADLEYSSHANINSPDPTLEGRDIVEALKDVQYISARFRGEVEELKKVHDWEAVARVLDRLFLVIFSAAAIIGTFAILFSAPALYDTTPTIS